MAAMDDEKSEDNSRDEHGNYITFIVNLTSSHITARLLTDHVVVNEEYQKLYSDTQQDIKSSHGVGVKVGVPDVGDLGVDYSQSNESSKKNKKLGESWKKLNTFLVQGGFNTIAPFKSMRFATKAAEVFVSIFVDGALKTDNWKISDREVRVEEAGIESAPVAKIAPLYNDSLFSHSYQAKMYEGLMAFKELYFYANGEGKEVLHSATVNLIGQSGIDFFGINLSTSKVLSLVTNRWFDKTVKQLYDAGMDIATIPVNQVQLMLTEISEQAKDIADAWATIATWYIKTKSTVHETQQSIQADDDEATNKIKAKVKEREKRLNEEMLKSTEWSTGSMVALGILTFGIAVGPMAEHNRKVRKLRKEYDEAIKELHAEQEHIVGVVKHISTLGASLEEMASFCSMMASYFYGQQNSFADWAATHGQPAKDISYKSWSPAECVNWIVTLHDGKFKGFEHALTKKFTKKGKEKRGKDLKGLTTEWFEDVLDMEEGDAQLLSETIETLVAKGEVSYRFVKSNYDDDVEWMKTHSASIKGINKFLVELQMKAAFLPKGVTISKGYGAVELKTFGESVSPVEVAKDFLKVGDDQE